MSGYVPPQFGLGVTFPIEKGSPGNRNLNVDDYRGITISHLISKILEKCVLENFGKYFLTSDSQFGFKKKVGCADAIFSLRSTVDYFVNNNSTVNICSLDVGKAFDRLNHYCFFLQLMSDLVPINLIMLLYNWYRNSTAVVIWKGMMSSSYSLGAGVRQGGVLSPKIFSKFVNKIIESIYDAGLGCHIGLQNMGIFMYADDLILVAGSVTVLQAMIDLCILEFNDLDLQINSKKSVSIRIGKGHKSECANLSVNGLPIVWADKIVYLGVTIITSTKFCIDLKSNRAKFYRSFNSLFSKICKANEYLIVSLVSTFCVPLVMYSLEALELNITFLNSLDNLLINVFAKIFKTFNRDILHSCMFYLNCLPLRYVYYNRRYNFLHKLSKSDNSVLMTWSRVFGKIELAKLCSSLNVSVCSHANIKKDIWNRFALSLGNVI